MDKENVFDGLPPKIWVMGGVFGVVMLALLIWLFTSGPPKDADHGEIERNAPSASADSALTNTPDIPVPSSESPSEALMGADSLEGTLTPVVDMTGGVLDSAERSGDDEALNEPDSDGSDSNDGFGDGLEAAGEGMAESPEPDSRVASAGNALTLENSDQAVRRQFASLNGAPFYKALWRQSNLLQRWVTFTFGLSKGQVMRPLVSLQSPKGSFPVRRVGTRYFLDESGFERYNSYVDTLTSIPPQHWSQNFHQFRPLMENIFEQMGYPADNFDNTVTKALHEIISAPIKNGALEVKAPSAMYVFVDNDIERMTALQKQLIRMGPDNAKKVQAYAVKVRSELLQGQ